MNVKIHLIRHSLTEANEKWLYCGFSDLPLSPNGEILVRHHALTGGYPAPENCCVYTSGMKRTEQTLQLLYGEIPHQSLPELREMNFGDFELNSYEKLKEDKAYLKWLSDGGETYPCPGGESAESFRKRVLRSMEELLTGGDAIVLCHGGVIAAIMAHYFSHETKSRYDWQPKPAEGYTMILQDGMPVDYLPIPTQYFE